MNAMTPTGFETGTTQSVAPHIRLVQSVAAAPRTVVACDTNRFADCMEAALTGVVVTGFLLFAAGLLRLGVPACEARMIGELVLHGLAVLSGGVTIFMTIHGILGK